MQTLIKKQKEEKLLTKNGFTKKWLSDKSGYWYIKKITDNSNAYADPQYSHYNIEVDVYDLMNNKYKKRLSREIVQHFKSLTKLLNFLNRN